MPPKLISRVKVVFFDAAGTLFYLPHGVGHHYAIIAARIGFLLDADKADLAFRRAWKDMPPPTPSRAPRPDDNRGWWRAVVDRVLDRCAVGDADREAYFSALYSHFAGPGVWELFPEARAVLETAQRHHRLAVISNFDGRLRPILRDLEIDGFFDDVLVSSEVGVDKPDPAIFSEALRRMEVDPIEALHVGDDPVADWAGAEAAGMHVFRLARPGNSLAGVLDLI